MYKFVTAIDNYTSVTRIKLPEHTLGEKRSNVSIAIVVVTLVTIDLFLRCKRPFFDAVFCNFYFSNVHQIFNFFKKDMIVENRYFEFGELLFPKIKSNESQKW